MAIKADFRSRAKAVRSYLRSLEDIESRLRSGKKTAFYRAAAAVDVSRAAAFIMIYNCVEFGFRESISALRNDVKLNAVDIASLRDWWRRDILRAKFLERMREGTSHVKIVDEMAAFLPGEIDWGGKEKRSPFSGNLDHEKLIQVAKDISGRKWRPPKASLGGSDLLLIRDTRNNLAHGEESFEDVGSIYTTSDIIEKHRRVKVFMESYLDAIERCRTGQSYNI